MRSGYRNAWSSSLPPPSPVAVSCLSAVYSVQKTKAVFGKYIPVANTGYN